MTFAQEYPCFHRCARGVTPPFNPSGLVLTSGWAHSVNVQAACLLILLCAAGCTAPGWAGDAFGTWKVNPVRSTGSYAENVTVRFAQHGKGEVLTLDRIDGEGRTTSASTI